MCTIGFPDSSLGKESTCNAGDPSSIHESGRSTVEETGHPLQYSWASLVAQLVKNPPAMWETWVRSLGWEDPVEKGKATHPGGSEVKASGCNAGHLGLIPGLGRSPGEGKGYPLQYSALENPMDGTVHGVTEIRRRLRDFHFQH